MVPVVEQILKNGEIMKFANLALATVIAVTLPGCATVLNGTSVDLDYLSEPDGAVVEISSGQTCTTPCTFSVKRGDDQRVDFALEGYRPEHVYVQSRLGGSTFGNIIAGGGIGAIVDGTNGASNVLYPRPVCIRLVALGSEEEAVLLDKDGEIIGTVAEHNEKVGEDVRKGLIEQGIFPHVPEEQEPVVATAEGAEEEAEKVEVDVETVEAEVVTTEVETDVDAAMEPEVPASEVASDDTAAGVGEVADTEPMGSE